MKKNINKPHLRISHSVAYSPEITVSNLFPGYHQGKCGPTSVTHWQRRGEKQKDLFSINHHYLTGIIASFLQKTLLSCRSSRCTFSNWTFIFLQLWNSQSGSHKKKKKTTNLGLKIQTLPLISTETEVHKSGQQELGPNATVCLRGVCAL